MADLKPQSPLQMGQDNLYPLTFASQVIDDATGNRLNNFIPMTYETKADANTKLESVKTLDVAYTCENITTAQEGEGIVCSHTYAQIYEAYLAGKDVRATVVVTNWGTRYMYLENITNYGLTFSTKETWGGAPSDSIALLDCYSMWHNGEEEAMQLFHSQISTKEMVDDAIEDLRTSLDNCVTATNFIPLTKVSQLYNVTQANGIFTQTTADTATTIVFKFQLYNNNAFVEQIFTQNLSSIGVYEWTLNFDPATTTFNTIAFGFNGSKVDTMVHYNADIQTAETYKFTVNILNITQGSLAWRDAKIVLVEAVADSALSTSSERPVQNKVIAKALNDKVDKVSGKSLSTNDYTHDEVTRLRYANIGYGVCSTDTATDLKVVELNNQLWKLNPGCIAIVKFTNAVKASDYITINRQSNQALFNKGSAITDGVIQSGDTAVLTFTSGRIEVLAVDRNNGGSGESLPLTGGTMTGAAVGMTSPDNVTPQFRNIVIVDAGTDLSTLSVPVGTIVMVRK